MTTRADQHDIDKLVRWRRDLTATPGSSFPAYAIFLVSAEDRLAHDIFRKFRASFEARNAGFANLVIFGQHGLSSTVRGLLAELDLPPEAVPSLVLLASPDATSVYSLPLPPGDGKTPDAGQPGQLWQAVLGRLEAAADEGRGPLELPSIDGLAQGQISRVPLVRLIDKLLGDLS